jgi:hypothetical protein
LVGPKGPFDETFTLDDARKGAFICPRDEVDSMLIPVLSGRALQKSGPVEFEKRQDFSFKVAIGAAQGKDTGPFPSHSIGRHRHG